MSHFNKVANSWDSPQKAERSRKFADEIKKVINLDDHLDIMDFGCGTGILGFEFIKNAKSIFGIDTSEGMLDVFDQKASEFSNITSSNINLEEETLDRKFDLIISSMAFHHLNGPDKMLISFSKMLNPLGQIVIIDLESEDGTFHPDNEGMGVKHFGFSEFEVSKWGQKSHMKSKFHIVDTICKNGRNYKLFLAVFNFV